MLPKESGNYGKATFVVQNQSKDSFLSDTKKNPSLRSGKELKRKHEVEMKQKKKKTDKN